ncbi:Zinc finger protein 26 [Eumeta japonica]|uniref:Zinc finger protein 26 n=1 Tax=Eumeta variegata TaxID=151549 RepID=A0A4C1TJQ3_EUMVA|nr:Zinc finger protein 26 [Eumeta japonica]
MKEIDINIEGYNVNGICVGCLNYNRRMLYSNYIIDCFKLLADIEVPDGLNIQVCWECLALIKKVYDFKSQIEKSYNILQAYSKQHMFLNSPYDLSKHAVEKLKCVTYMHSTHYDDLKENYLEKDAVVDTAVVKSENEEESLKEEPKDFTGKNLKSGYILKMKKTMLNVFCPAIRTFSFDATQAERIQSCVREGLRLSLDEENEDSDPETPSKRSRLYNEEQPEPTEKQSKNATAQEIAKYTALAKADRKINPYEWWALSTNKNGFPILNDITIVKEELPIEVDTDFANDTDFPDTTFEQGYSDDEPIANLKKKKKRHHKEKHTNSELLKECTNIKSKKLRKLKNLPEDIVTLYTMTEEELWQVRSQDLVNDEFLKLKYKCIECILKFNSEKLMTDHMTSKHKPVHRDAVASNLKDVYRCSECRKEFISKSKLAYHKGICLQERPQCDCCGKVFANKLTLKHHLKVIHEGVVYPCPVCGKLFSWRRNLNRHLRNHREREAGAVHECRLCGKRFSSRDCYNNHMRFSKRHADERHYQHECSHCGKKFPTKWCMIDHIDWDHLKKIKYQCGVCLKAFKTAKIKVAHMNNIHGSKKKESEGEHLCEICGKSYKKSTAISDKLYSFCADCKTTQGACVGDAHTPSHGQELQVQALPGDLHLADQHLQAHEDDARHGQKAQYQGETPHCFDEPTSQDSDCGGTLAISEQGDGQTELDWKYIQLYFYLLLGTPGDEEPCKHLTFVFFLPFQPTYPMNYMPYENAAILHDANRDPDAILPDLA